MPLVVLLLAACSPEVPTEPEAKTPACSSDADCPQGKLCAGGSCVLPEGPRPSECATSDDCLAEPTSVVPDLYWDGDETICTLDPQGCTSGSCDARRVCLEPQESATRPGAIRCVADEQCSSGRCVEHEGDSVCLRTCVVDGDCASELDAAGNLVGDRCALVEVAGASLLACVPAVPGKTLCRRDCDCTGDDTCPAPAADAPRCRFAGPDPHLARCEPLPASAARGPMLRCGLAAQCAGGACLDPCTGIYDGIGVLTFCSAISSRCAQPCDADDDCPERTLCLHGPPWLRIGDWHFEGVDPVNIGREFNYCQLPKLGCFDDLDCFGFDRGADHFSSWGEAETRCAVSILRPSSSPRLITTCQEPVAGKLLPGKCCDTNDECDTGICTQAAGAHCPGRGMCTVPCDLDPAPVARPGPGTGGDRCSLLADWPASIPEWPTDTHCEEITYERELVGDDGVTRTFSTPLRVCR